MKVAIIGANGQLGRDLVDHAKRAGHTVVALDLPEIDITNPNTTLASIREIRPAVIINPAAFTAVDEAEGNAEVAFRVNELGAANLAQAAADVGARMIHFSTDYVFDGKSKTPYTEGDMPNPLTVYGQSKLAGEKRVAAQCPNHQIVRIAWLYGVHGANFVKTMLKIARKNAASGTVLKVVHDQWGSPTCTLDVCKQIIALLVHSSTGVFHATSEGACTWFDFTRLIVRLAGIEVEVVPCTTAEFPRPAPRPAYSVLDNSRLKELGINKMPSWEKAYEEFWQTYKNEL